MITKTRITHSGRVVAGVVWALVSLIGAANPSAASAVAADSRAQERSVWQYTGGYGPSWFVHEGGGKWIIYRGDGRTFLYVEEARSDAFIELRGPVTGLLIRLSDEQFESRRSSDQPWRRSAGGGWVGEEALPEYLREAPREPMIRLVYFVPTDRDPAADFETRIRLVMSIVSDLIHDDLVSKGLRPRRLPFESPEDEPLVHLVRGEEPAAFYTEGWENDRQEQVRRIHAELLPRFGDPERHLTLVFAETYDERPIESGWYGHVALGSAKPPDGGFAVYSSWLLGDDFTALDRDGQLALFFDGTPIRGRRAFGSRIDDSPRFEFVEDAYGAVCHELGHALGLPHDYRGPRNIMGLGFREIRWNLDPDAPRSRRALFSADNARMLMSSRYLATDLNREDYDPPQVDFELRRSGRTITAVVRASDDTGLRAILFYDRTPRVSTLAGGQGLDGTSAEVIQRIPVETVRGGPPPQVEVFVSDQGGNVTRVIRTLAESD